VSFSATVVGPEIAGGEVFVGAVAGCEAACTTVVAAELAGAAVPPALIAAYSTRIVFPTSVLASSYVWSVAPPITVQLLPAALQSSH